jgi:predicted DNA binding CopG/RHH family protein
VKDFSNFVRLKDHPEHPLYRALTQSMTIRMASPDILAARHRSRQKGIPYQTYIKQLLNDALERELANQAKS